MMIKYALRAPRDHVPRVVSARDKGNRDVLCV